MNIDKNIFFDLINSHIKDFGYHITIVVGNTPLPRYAYTIGLKETIGFEIIFGGSEFYGLEEVKYIINKIVLEFNNNNWKERIIVDSLGTFSLSKVHQSWSKLMMLGVYDFYKIEKFTAMQIIPDFEHSTLDIPDMSKQYDGLIEPAWKWLQEEWSFDVPLNSMIITNLNALKGEPITEVMRWEVDEWEAFAGAGPDVEKEDIRIVSLGTLLGIDKSLEAILKLNVGKGIWRSSEELIWNDWN